MAKLTFEGEESVQASAIHRSWTSRFANRLVSWGVVSTEQQGIYVLLALATIAFGISFFLLKISFYGSVLTQTGPTQKVIDFR